MRTLATTAIIIAAAIALAGCTSTPESASTSGVDPSPASSSSAPASTETSTEDAAPPTASGTLEEIAATAGLSDFARSTSAAPGAIAWGQGTLDGNVVKVYEFADDAGYQAFIASVAGFGITEDQLVHVGNFAFAPNDSAQLEQLRAAVG